MHIHTNFNTNNNSDANHTCFHNSHGVFKSIAQAARIEAGLCEFARARQQHQSLGISSGSKKWHRDHVATGDTHNRGGMWRSHPELFFDNSYFKDREKTCDVIRAHTQI
jgi:hypothetical protein